MFMVVLLDVIACSVAKTEESEQERSKRHRQRTLFDGAAQLYQASRPGYPREMVEFLVATAGVGAGSKVLEVGCGTGQLTEGLLGFGFDLTAIDIGPAMIAEARLRAGSRPVSFEVTAFEDFTAASASFDLIVSGAAYHWVDPEIKFTKPARLLRPGGWLALIGTGERYEDPLGTTLLDMWIARSDDRGAWAKQWTISDAVRFTDSGVFEKPVQREDYRPAVVPVDEVIGVENTRATSLSWPEPVRREFTQELQQHLASQTHVQLTYHTVLTMARLRGR
jgi:SAM-dependent methyltransferase